MMWWSEDIRLEREQREKAAFAFWDACRAQDAYLAATEYLWRRPGSPTMEERRVAQTNA
jgi:hypothetical protein